MTDIRPARLKALELQGYKTFVNRTNFVFAPTITAIVGPNGSGKSNVSDAIRWVLGEQAYSLLRGKKTEDMIFSGSESRPRASMASAVITFDNSDGWLPIEFAEVSVGRRAYRDGENEYLLNGQRVRLRELVELLARSGLAQRTYTIIGQGLVDAALSLRAEERRALFEEAAGIGLYRSRREESLRRLESTERNLERVQDILAELRPRLRALERQARRAQEYEEVRRSLQEGLRQWYGHHWHRSQALVAAARREAADKIDLRDSLRGRQGQAVGELARRRSEISGLKTQLHAWLEQEGILNVEREDLQRRIAVDAERVRWLQEQGLSLVAEIKSLDTTLGEARARLERAQGEMAAEEEALRRAGSEPSEAARLHPESSALNADPLESVVAREAGWKARLEAATTGREAAVRRQEALTTELSIHAGELRQVELAHSAAQEQMMVEEKAAFKAASDLEDARESLRKARAESERAESDRARWLERLAGLEARLEVLAAREQTLHRLLEAGEEGRLPGLVGRWANQWRVSPSHQTAISAALGPFADGLTFRHSEDIDRAVAEIAQNEAQATTAFLPTAADLLPVRLQPPSDPELIGLAADLVSAPAEMRSVIDLLLGKTLVVQSAAAARRLLGGLPPDSRVVTLEGEVFYRGGPVLVLRREGGRDAQQRLSAELEKARVELEVKHHEARRLAAEVGSLVDEVGRAELAQAEERSSLAEAAHASHEQALRREASRQRVALLTSQASEMEQILAQAETAQKILETELREIRIARGVAEAARLESDREKSARLLAGSSAGLELLRRAASEARRQVQERAERVADLEAEIQGRNSRLEANASFQSETQRQIDEAQARLSQVETEREATRAQSQPAEAARAEAETEKDRLEASEDRGRLELQQAESEAARIQIELARREEEAMSLRRRMEDDFGLVALPLEDGVPTPDPLPFEGLVQVLPSVEDLPLEVEVSVQRLRGQIRRMGAVNPEADREYQEVRERVEFLTAQTSDLRAAEAELRQVIDELDELMQKEFLRTFDAVAAAFRQTFTRLFQGGSARLTLVNPDNLAEAGIEIEARLPGKREQGLAMLSGGERSLTACALIFALLKVSPTPFCVLDEVDAMLDEANVARFREMLVELSADTQFLVITHNRETVQGAQTVYGISMSPDSASQVISLRLDEAVKSLAA